MAKRSRDSLDNSAKKSKKEKKKHKKQKRLSHENAGTSSERKKKHKKSSTQGQVFQEKTVELVVTVLPGALRDIQSSLEASISQWLLKYCDALEGIMLAFRNTKILSKANGNDVGWVYNELPHIHYTVSCDALVFCPQIGCKLTGVVNQCFPSHLGMLVHEYFNAMISSEHLRASGYIFDTELQEWTSADDRSQVISNGDKVDFVVEKIHECEGTISLEGAKPSLSPLVDV